jgi:TRAP-type C4-dicarboxylate transport system permease large subunit
MVANLAGWDVSRWLILGLIMLVYLLLGCVMDQIAILVLTLPITLPVIEVLGFDPVWFGIIIVVTAEIGLITPPLGLNVFVVARYTKRPLGEVFLGVVPFGAAMLMVLAVLVALPSIVLWLPGLMSQ